MCWVSWSVPPGGHNYPWMSASVVVTCTDTSKTPIAFVHTSDVYRKTRRVCNHLYVRSVVKQHDDDLSACAANFSDSNRSHRDHLGCRPLVSGFLDVTTRSNSEWNLFDGRRTPGCDGLTQQCTALVASASSRVRTYTLWIQIAANS